MNARETMDMVAEQNAKVFGGYIQSNKAAGIRVDADWRPTDDGEYVEMRVSVWYADEAERRKQHPRWQLKTTRTVLRLHKQEAGKHAASFADALVYTDD